MQMEAYSVESTEIPTFLMQYVRRIRRITKETSKNQHIGFNGKIDNVSFTGVKLPLIRSTELIMIIIIIIAIILHLKFSRIESVVKYN
jgi:hypothetical protein